MTTIWHTGTDRAYRVTRVVTFDWRADRESRQADARRIFESEPSVVRVEFACSTRKGEDVYAVVRRRDVA